MATPSITQDISAASRAKSGMEIDFPQVSGRNLMRQEVSLPAGFTGEYNLVLVAFQQWQQQQVDSWIATIKSLRNEQPGLEYFELPVISDRSFLWKMFINEGMRAGIPNQDTRQRTITLYLDKSAFREALNMPDEADIYLLLLDRAGRVKWQTRGWHSAVKANQLRNSLGKIARA